MSNRIETGINIAIVVVAVFSVLMSVVFVQKYFFARYSVNLEHPLPTMSRRVNLSGFNTTNTATTDQQKTLILALQKGCHFCSESAPFYKRLIQGVQGKNIKLVAILPGKAEESTEYLKSLGLTGIEVKQLSLGDLEVTGTPTLILTNDKGEATAFWVGKLTRDKEEDVINKLNS